jgi:hypothetical protein
MFAVNVMIRDEMWLNCLKNAVLLALGPTFLFLVSASTPHGRSPYLHDTFNGI